MNDHSNPNVGVNDTAQNVAQSGLMPVFQNSGNNLQLQSQLTQTIGTQDLVSIKTAATEKRLQRALAERTKAAEAAKSERDEAIRALNTYLKTFPSEDLLPSPIKAAKANLTEALSGFSNPPAVTTKLGDATLDNERRTISFSFTVAIGSGYSGVITLSHTQTSSFDELPELAELVARFEEAEKAYTSANKAVASARSALSNIESMERQARATLATGALNNAGEAGKALAEQLTEDPEDLSDDDLVSQLAAY